jgi:hypothetical protein
MNNFSPEAKVIAAFTFVVALLFGGWAGVGGLAASFFMNSYLPEMPNELFTVFTTGTVIAVAVGTLFIARSAAAATETLWVRHLGEATVLLSWLVIAAAIFALLTGLLNGEGGGILPIRRY